MILKRFYDEKLAQASYLVGCAATGESLVVDPNRDVDQYVETAAAEGLRITHVTETHIHADFVSGSRELAQRTGAQLYLSDEGDENWKYAFAADAAAILVRDGSRFEVGNVRIDVVHMPGHTPEHVCFIVTDTAGADRPMGIFSGDFVFVGDVGRPDLLERAAKYEGTMEAGARTLFRSLERFKRLPDYLQIWPGHGAGSACGKALGAVPQSTVGYEKLFNWGLSFADEDAFVHAVLEGQPEPPRYFAEMKRINKEGPRILNGFRLPPRQDESRLGELIGAGVPVVDTRPAAEFAAAHVRGTLNIPLNRSFTTWAGWLLPYGADFHLIVDESDEGALAAAVRDLAMIGLDRVAGYFATSAVGERAETDDALGTVEEIEAAELARQMAAGSVTAIDVRGRAEWEAGHIPGTENIPVGYLVERLNEIPRNRPVVVHCQSGGRSAIAASVLLAAGVHDVRNYLGGFEEWQAQGRAVQRGSAEPANA